VLIFPSPQATRHWDSDAGVPTNDHLPEMTLAAALDSARIPRVAGLTDGRTALVTTRPCRAPHHTISAVGLIGGGYLPMPGEVWRAHYGILCLDARPECRRHILEVLRQPL
jgi:magnesium chelatase family protein